MPISISIIIINDIIMKVPLTWKASGWSGREKVRS